LAESLLQVLCCHLLFLAQQELLENGFLVHERVEHFEVELAGADQVHQFFQFGHIGCACPCLNVGDVLEDTDFGHSVHFAVDSETVLE